MTVSAEKLRVNPVINGRAIDIPCGTVLGPVEDLQILFLQDYKSTFTGNMPNTSISGWSSSYQIVDYVANCVAKAWPNAEIGLAHFSDWPEEPYGNPDEDFVYQEILPLTKVSDTFPLNWNTYSYTTAQHDGKSSVDGGDDYNCALDAINNAVTSTTIGWNNKQYNRFVVVFTDQLPHDSGQEPGVPHISQYTMEYNCWFNNIQPIYVLINDDYDLINKKFVFGADTSHEYLINDYNSLLFGKSPLFIGNPDWIVNYDLVSSKILASIYNLITTYWANE